ncbi:MAG: FKBP-type peptidyl-prolyl cis-trans isomerase, partial [Armatimonadetes bacterium]|nr:FKBP-type peptidyl-prolyl cis-trans isomerase [Armatimonadota bacterium]
MEVQHERDQAGMTTVRAEVPAEVVNEVYDKALRRLKRQVNVPGFRRGKVPPKMVESILGKENILEYAKELFEERVVPEALSELPTLVALEAPELTIDHFERGEAAQVTVRVLTAMVQLGETKGLAVEQMRSVIEDAAAEAELARYHQTNATYAEADHSDVRDGDHVLFALRIVRDGLLMEEYTSEDPLRVKIGDNHLNPNIDDHLIGVSAGQTTSFEVTYPDDYENEDLRGATVEFTVEILAVQNLEPMDAMFERLGVTSKED